MNGSNQDRLHCTPFPKAYIVPQYAPHIVKEPKHHSIRGWPSMASPSMFELGLDQQAALEFEIAIVL